MAPHNIEKIIKEKLEPHEIMPSATAWNKLNLLLVANKTKKKKSTASWIAIAATVTIAFGLLLHYFDKNLEPKLIAENKLKQIITNKNNSGFEVQKSNLKTTNQVVLQSKSTVIIVTKTAKKANDTILYLKTNEALENQEKPLVQNILKNEIRPDDSLINALNQITLKNNTNNKIKVNPASLLLQVDQELNLTFKEKVFKKIDQSYTEVKAVIASRNTTY
jgi:hypothetical protein